jgi:abhydrolase domain-containing protein 6
VTGGPKPRRRTGARILIAVVVLIVGATAFLYYNPLWLVDRSVDLYLRGKGVQHEYVTVDGNRLHYLEVKPKGQSRSERPLLLIHGLGARALDWAPMLPELAEHGYHVYAIDLLGYGASPKPKEGDFSLAGEENVVLGFMNALHLQQADVAGWSMGGWVATKVAMDRPDLVHRLLLYDSAGMYFVIDFPLSLFSPMDRAGLDALAARIEPDVQHIHLPAFAVPGMLRKFRENKWIVDSSFHSMLTGREILDFRVGKLKMPVLIVWGTEDKLTPFDLALKLHDLLPQSVLVGITGCGHLAAAECAKQVLPITERFIDSESPLPPSKSIIDSGWPGSAKHP